MPDALANFRAILRALSEHGVEYILIGGMSAVLQGAPIMTLDVDIVHCRDPRNLERLTAALTALGAYYREHPQRLAPESTFLTGPGHHLFMTRLGRLDVLGEVGGHRTYEDLLPQTVDLEIEPGFRVRTLSLAMLITLKEEAGRDKDMWVLPILRAALKEQMRGKE